MLLSSLQGLALVPSYRECCPLLSPPGPASLEVTLPPGSPHSERGTVIAQRPIPASIQGPLQSHPALEVNLDPLRQPSFASAQS
jgi:hypothetical protein